MVLLSGLFLELWGNRVLLMLFNVYLLSEMVRKVCLYEDTGAEGAMV